MLETTSIITNGYIDIDTIDAMAKSGWAFLCTIPAKPAHPYAMDTDKLSFFSKYTEDQTNTIPTSGEESTQ